MFGNFPYPLYNGQAPNIQVEKRNKDYTRPRIIQGIVDILIIILIFVAFIIVATTLDPRIRGFHCSDTDIFNPYRSNTVPFYAVVLYGTIGPIVCIVIVEYINAMRTTLSHPNTVFFVSILHAILLFVLGIALTILLTEIGKRWIGRLRPHFIDVCKPDFSKVNCTTTTGGSGNIIYNFIDTNGSFCTGNAADVKEARLSFPSGHSSYACYTMAFLILYLEARVRIVVLRFFKAILQLAAFCAAYTTSISRIPDYHHRGSDVIGGIVLGVLIALFTGFVAGRVLWYFGISEATYDVSDD